MISFCASPFWDWDYTWYSEYPRLTPCFENTVLAYTPAILLVLFGLLPWLVGRRKKQSLNGEPLSWTLLSLSRFVVSLLLTLTYGYSLVYKLAFDSSSGSSVTADLVHAVTFAIALKVQQNTRQNGQGSSMVLFFFWLMSVVCQLPKYSRHLQEVFALDSDLTDFSKIEFVVCATSYPMILVQFFLSCWTDARQDTRRPYLTAAPVSFIFMGWLSPLIFRRARNNVELEDIYSIPPAMTTRRNHNYMAKGDPTWKGVFYAIGIVSANFCSGMLVVHIDRILSFTGLNAKTVMVAAIYRKTLRLSSESQKVYTIGELINLISVDADRIFRLSITFGYVASGVPLIIITLVILWQYLGVACLAGVVVMLVIMPVVAIAVSIGNKYQTAQMKLKDKRLNTMAEMLSSVKVLKLFAWENLFMDKCSSVRSEEMGLLKKYSYLTALSFFILTCSSSMVALLMLMWALPFSKTLLDHEES
ncbi:hypothetical protein HPB47_022812 [Ixodes persulcatus]|uniref:Uncharacterized protein n=1 Tax=Ixodes persulcatus TaxID=34615 RepID=A0AC60QC31_IXOPE|nr:hypothetical protein HPB47_022812 [Ixodes persulcatus]